MNVRWSVAGGLLLGALWLGPLPDLVTGSFAAHMALHVTVIAAAAPLLALGVAGTRYDPVRAAPRLFAPLPASLLELAVVWGWHLPASHDAAAESAALFAWEQASYLAAGLLVWLAAFGRPNDPGRRAAGVAMLWFTSMHMTLLGVLLAVTPRPLYHNAGGPTLTPLGDQQIGGVIMLSVAGLTYLAGGLYLLADLLRREAS